MQTKRFLEHTLPLALSGLLLCIMLVTIIIQARAAALTTDEAMHASYGQTTLAWYLTLGKNRGFLTYPQNTYEPQHGAIFDALVAAAQHITHEQWLTEALAIGLSGVLGVVAIALCGLELGGWWFAWLAALSLWLYPRFYGALLNNPKDIPFTTVNTFVLWSALRLFSSDKHAQRGLFSGLLVAFFLGLALAIRVNGVVWYPILGLILASWWLLNWSRVRAEGELWRIARQHMITGGLIISGSFLCSLALWPYVFLNPPGHFYEAVVVIARYPWNGSVLFQGKMQLATTLPRTYALTWLLIGSPPFLLLCAAPGLGALGRLALQKRVLNLPMLLVFLAFALPLSMIMALHSVLYNGLRQFLFLIPPLILLAIYGFTRALSFLWRRGRTALLFAWLLCLTGSTVWTLLDLHALHPYEYAYFSPLIGGLPGAQDRYEIDYWNTCQRAASIWLGAHYRSYTSRSYPTIQYKPIKFQYLTYLPANFRTARQKPDFLLDIPPFSSPTELARYRLIHLESIQNVPLCKVYAEREGKERGHP